MIMSCYEANKPFGINYTRQWNKKKKQQENCIKMQTNKTTQKKYNIMYVKLKLIFNVDGSFVCLMFDFNSE